MVETLTCRACGAEALASSIRCPSCHARLTPLRAAGRAPKVAAAPVSDLAEEAPAAEQAPQGGWHPDPSGKHELRWWDGQNWTEHTSTNGVQAVDPM